MHGILLQKRFSKRGPTNHRSPPQALAIDPGLSYHQRKRTILIVLKLSTRAWVWRGHHVPGKAVDSAAYVTTVMEPHLVL